MEDTEMDVHSGVRLQAGDALEHYQLIEPLDRRRAVEIWRGQHISQQTQVVLKILPRAGCAPEDYQRIERRLRNEALVLAGLHHRHIIGLHTYLEEQNYCALVLEYAACGSVLSHHGSGRRLPLSLVRLYTMQIAQALESMHRQQLVHCDVKPGNILLANAHHALLADFGVALYTYVQARYQGGTPSYMAPEQYRGHPGPASDQYGLATSVYEWLTGHRPFYGEARAIVHRRERSIPRSVRIFRPELPDALDRVLRVALHPDPAQRYPGVLAFAREFTRIARTVRPPLVNRLPYYRAPVTDVASLEEQWLSGRRRLPVTEEREIVRLPLLLPAVLV
jgi:serine/threonine protein kinase